MTSVFRVARLFAVAATVVAALALSTSSAFAVNVKLRIEGQSTTHFNGAVSTGPRAVQGGPPSSDCPATATPNNFATANTLTAVADAIGEANYTTSGTQYDWGVMLCTVFGEQAAATGGWLLKINNLGKPQPKGFVTATDELKEGDSVVVYRSDTYDQYDGSLDLRLPVNAQPGQPITAIVDQWANANDARSDAAGVKVSGGGASGTTGPDGRVTLTFPSSGEFLVTAEKADKIRGSARIKIDPSTPAPPVKKKVNRFVKCNKAYRKRTKKHRRCIRIVRAKQAAARR